MAAKDYEILCANFDAYIGKKSKKNPNIMLQDRRAIPEEEIMYLIDWYMNREIDMLHTALTFTSHQREGKRVQLKYIDNDNQSHRG